MGDFFLYLKAVYPIVLIEKTNENSTFIKEEFFYVKRNRTRYGE